MLVLWYRGIKIRLEEFKISKSLAQKVVHSPTSNSTSGEKPRSWLEELWGLTFEVENEPDYLQTDQVLPASLSYLSGLFDFLIR